VAGSQDLAGRGAEEVLVQHAARLEGQLNPSVPGTGNPDTPVLVHYFGDPGPRPGWERPERIAIQVNQVPVLPHEPVAELRKLAGRAEGLRR
jgi:hypothetical protein